jgi:hypothetical protein
VALYFSQFNGKGVRPAKAARVVYFFFLDRARDPYLNGAQLYDRLGALRPARQQCGAMIGATMLTSNTYARYVSAQAHIDDCLMPEGVDQDFLFPSEYDDKVFELVCRAMDQAKKKVFADSKAPAPTDDSQAKEVRGTVTIKLRFRMPHGAQEMRHC